MPTDSPRALGLVDTDPSMTVVHVGVDYRAAPVALRERLVARSDLFDALSSRMTPHLDPSVERVREYAVLSTCNRLELYAVVSGTRADPALQARALLEVLADVRDVESDVLARCAQWSVGSAAVEHLCRVASGLESMVLGESEILGQVAHAHRNATYRRVSGRTLDALFRSALRAGRRARAETTIGRGPASVSSVAAALAKRTIGDVTGARLLIVGAGRVGGVSASILRAESCDITIISRSLSRATQLATGCGGRALAFDCLTTALAEADVVISATAAPHAVIDCNMVRQAMCVRDGRPLSLIDIAVPRDVDPDVRDIPGVTVFDIDDLQSMVDGGLAERRRAIPAVEQIIAEEVERTMRSMPNAIDETRLAVERLSHSLLNTLLQSPTHGLRSHWPNDSSAIFARVTRELFGFSTSHDTIAERCAAGQR